MSSFYYFIILFSSNKELRLGSLGLTLSYIINKSVWIPKRNLILCGFFFQNPATRN
jgi:hypothetical protein